VDVIAQNDSGAFATRKLLSEALGAGEDRLAGKKVVIWEFAARELSVGDWRPYRYALGAAGK
jgi:alginate O-acetyltransferase complex protein AlgJ